MIALTVAFAISCAPITAYKDYTAQLLTPKQMGCVDKLWALESNWNPKADNPYSTAYGIPQLLKMKERNPYRQIDRGLAYIKHRYETPCAALKHHKSKGWY
jgi:hypothetical protein